MKWKDILKIDNERARALAREYAPSDYEAGKKENAERISKPLVKEVDKLIDAAKEIMPDTEGELKEEFQELLGALNFFRRKVFKDGEYKITTSAEAEEFKRRLIPVKKYLRRNNVPLDY